DSVGAARLSIVEGSRSTRYAHLCRYNELCTSVSEHCSVTLRNGSRRVKRFLRTETSMSQETGIEPRRRPGIRAVARRAGVSLGTVSAVLNEKPSVSADARDRVE